MKKIPSTLKLMKPMLFDPTPSLYIHIPWCIQKCPYCDFNSHKQTTASLPETQYLEALLADFSADLRCFPNQKIKSIFIGGGTPSLLSSEFYEALFTGLKSELGLATTRTAQDFKEIEITLEANPGTVDQSRFQEYRALGINRLSLGIQSFNPKHLQKLGRIHDDKQAHKAIEVARLAGFDNLNLDLMYGLPNQSLAEGLDDLKQALHYQSEHLSWYQLTIEPNTIFYKTQPPLPTEDLTEALEQAGLELLQSQGLNRYEISAFSRPEKESQHNLNYWLFGDYYGIGAGAHAKYHAALKSIRTNKLRQPKDYLAALNKKTAFNASAASTQSKNPFLAAENALDAQTLIFEFMLNTTRLEQAIPKQLFSERTGLPYEALQAPLQKAVSKGLLKETASTWQITPLGRRYTNDLQILFLPNTAC